MDEQELQEFSLEDIIKEFSDLPEEETAQPEDQMQDFILIHSLKIITDRQNWRKAYFNCSSLGCNLHIQISKRMEKIQKVWNFTSL